MLDKIKRALDSISKLKPSFDPSIFDDDVALKTEWRPLKGGGTNFRTHKLKVTDQNRIEFKSTPGAKLFSLIFLTIGLGIPIYFGMDLIYETTDLFRSDFLVLLLFGSVFALVGGFLFYRYAKPIIFDKRMGLYWKGWKAPKHYLDKMEEGSSSRIGNIHALQIIPELVRGDKKSYYSYELNLVFKDGSRMNVVDHGNPLSLRDDSKKLAEFLNVPIWDAGLRDDTNNSQK